MRMAGLEGLPPSRKKHCCRNRTLENLTVAGTVRNAREAGVDLAGSLYGCKMSIGGLGVLSLIRKNQTFKPFLKN